jgi:hypothetical protein
VTLLRLRRAAPAAVLAAAAALGLAGCGDTHIKADTPYGNKNHAFVTLIDTPVVKVFKKSLPPNVGAYKTGLYYGTGTPEDLVSTVKNGWRIDLVVLPAGADLQRLKNELVQPPVPLGKVGSEQYYVAPVTRQGWALARYFLTPKGKLQLQQVWTAKATSAA